MPWRVVLLHRGEPCINPWRKIPWVEKPYCSLRAHGLSPGMVSQGLGTTTDSSPDTGPLCPAAPWRRVVTATAGKAEEQG